MQANATIDPAAIPVAAGRRAPSPRTALALAAAVAVAGGGAILAGGDGAAHDPDLLRLMRFMAAIKGGFALAALAACLWRLARPSAPWRCVVYVAGPALMIVGACGLWALRAPGLAALALHGGLFAVLAAALTDPDFVPDALIRRRDRRASAAVTRQM